MDGFELRIRPPHSQDIPSQFGHYTKVYSRYCQRYYLPLVLKLELELSLLGLVPRMQTHCILTQLSRRLLENNLRGRVCLLLTRLSSLLPC